MRVKPDWLLTWPAEWRLAKVAFHPWATYCVQKSAALLSQTRVWLVLGVVMSRHQAICPAWNNSAIARYDQSGTRPAVVASLPCVSPNSSHKLACTCRWTKRNPSSLEKDLYGIRSNTGSFRE